MHEQYIEKCKHYWDMVESFTLNETAALWCDTDPELADQLARMQGQCFTVKKRVLSNAIRNKRIPYSWRGSGNSVSSTGWVERLTVEEMIENDVILLAREELAKWFEQLPTGDRPAFLFGVDRHLAMPDNRPDAPHPFDNPRHREARRHKERVRAIAALIWKGNPSKTIADMIQSDAINGIACENRNPVYSEDTLRKWVKDLNPQEGQPGRPPKVERRPSPWEK